MFTRATWSRVVQSRKISAHDFDGLAMLGFAFSVVDPSLLDKNESTE